MPEDVLELLNAEGVWQDYQARPAYQQNDYLGWILELQDQTPATSEFNRCSMNSGLVGSI